MLATEQRPQSRFSQRQHP